jgi:hypothetical protein
MAQGSSGNRIWLSGIALTRRAVARIGSTMRPAGKLVTLPSFRLMTAPPASAADPRSPPRYHLVGIFLGIVVIVMGIFELGEDTGERLDCRDQDTV